MKRIILIFAIFALCEKAWGHGMLLDPAGRSSRWRFDRSAPTNPDDNGLFCGGFGVQYNINGGKCGLCGDDYRDPTPRANELGGTFGGKGVTVRTYDSKKHTATIDFAITANHMGYVFFNLCNLDKNGKETEKCFDEYRLKFADGSDKFFVGNKRGSFTVTVVLPRNLICKHCVLRWTYKAGNNWGICGDGTGKLGCGDQEHFKSCADITIA